MTEKREPRTLSIPAAAKRLEMSARQLRELVHAGVVPAMRISERAQWRVLASFVRAYETELERKAAEAAEEGRAYARRSVG